MPRQETWSRNEEVYEAVRKGYYGTHHITKRALDRWIDNLNELFNSAMTVGYSGDENYKYITKYLRDEAQRYHIQLNQRDRYDYQNIIDSLYPQKNGWVIQFKDNDRFNIIHMKVNFRT